MYERHLLYYIIPRGKWYSIDISILLIYSYNSETKVIPDVSAPESGVNHDINGGGNNDTRAGDNHDLGDGGNLEMVEMIGAQTKSYYFIHDSSVSS